MMGLLGENRVTIREFSGVIIGYIDTDSRTGNKTARDFYNKILGYYYADRNVTTNFYNQIVAQGDCTSGLIYEEAAKQKWK